MRNQCQFSVYLMGLITACLICTVSTPALGDFTFVEAGLGATVNIHENKFEVGTERAVSGSQRRFEAEYLSFF